MTGFFSAAADFDPARLKFAFRTALAACLALLAAAALGLDHPQWAAMTVWVVSQPTRGQWVEKSLSRVAGTIIGSLFGVVLVILVGWSPALLILGLAAWIGLCAGAGNVLRGPISYATLLAGYSAAMIAMLDHSHPELVFSLAWDRVLTICTGAAASAVTGLLLTPRIVESELDERLGRFAESLLDHIEAALAGRIDQDGARRLLSEMAAIDDGLETHFAGTLGLRAKTRAVRTVFSAAMTLLLWARDPGAGQNRADVHAEAAPDHNDRIATRLQRLSNCREPHVAALAEKFRRAWQAHLDMVPEPVEREISFLLHRDWIGARYAAIRSAGAVALVGAIWIVTGLTIGPFMVMGTAIMITLFSTFDNPALQMRFVFGASIGGALAALLGHFLVLPLGDSQLALLLLTMPFILLGALVMSHRRSMAGGMDYNMVSLLLINPAYPMDMNAAHALGQAIAVVAGPAIALVGFTYAFPVTPRRRLDTIVRMMAHDLAEIAAADAVSKDRIRLWRPRLYHRFLRLVRLSERSGESQSFATEGGLAVLGLGEAILAARALSTSADTSPDIQRAARAFLLGAPKLSQRPERLLRLLGHLAVRMERRDPAAAAVFAKAFELVTTNEPFFRRAGDQPSG
jgi:uncharacterized membrane protein YccC